MGMSDIRILEKCTCGASIEVSGYMAEVRNQMSLWRRARRLHLKEPKQAEGTGQPNG